MGKFDLMYAKRAFVHHYVGEGMEEGEFSGLARTWLPSRRTTRKLVSRLPRARERRRATATSSKFLVNISSYTEGDSRTVPGRRCIGAPFAFSQDGIELERAREIESLRTRAREIEHSCFFSAGIAACEDESRGKISSMTYC